MDNLNATQRDLLALAAWLYYRVECFVAAGDGDSADVSATDDAAIAALCGELLARLEDVRQRKEQRLCA